MSEHRCLCTYHKCKDSRTADGQPGVLLKLRQFRSHQENEQRLKDRASVQEARDRAIHAQEEAMATAMSSLSVSAPTEPTLSPADKYRIDHVVRLVAIISELKDDASSLQKEVEGIGSPLPGISYQDERLQDTLLQFGSSRQRANEMLQRLGPLKRGEYCKDHSVRAIREQTIQKLQEVLQLIGQRERIWNGILLQRQAAREAFVAQGGVVYDCSKHYRMMFGGAMAIIQLVTLMVVAVHVLLGLPRRGSHWLFSMVEYILEVCSEKSSISGTLPPFFEQMFKKFPHDIRTATSVFDLEPKATVYATCPKCHQIYQTHLVDSVPTYRERCNSHKFGSRCGQLLVRPKRISKRTIYIPILPYVSFDFKDWLSNLLSRVGNEEAMDKAWERMNIPPDGHLDDVFQGSVIREFKGPDKRTHFSVYGPQDAGRYLFSVGADFFNPLRNIAAGKKISLGIIAVICLSLPIHLRYKPENMFLAGIIPGPKEPRLDLVQPYLRPLIDSFLEFWAGVFFTKTLLKAFGRLVFCALVLIICDLPAARKFAGFASFSHERFCTVCCCNLSEHGHKDFDYKNWKRREPETCRHQAESYRTAETKKQAQSSFDLTGIRWSELFRLPYFDPTKHLIVDPMHNLFLGLIKEHFQNVLGYFPPETKKKQKRKRRQASTNEIQINIIPTADNPLTDDHTSRKSIRKLINYLTAPLDAGQTQEDQQALVKKWCHGVNKTALTYVTRGLNVYPNDYPRVGKLTLAERLMTWRRSQVAQAVPDDVTNPNEPSFGNIITHEEMKEVYADFERLVKPSWVTSIPSTVSTVGPKLKSDQWRTFGSLNLPVTLIRLWTNDDPQDELRTKRQELLHLTMLLFSAIAVATTRVTSDNHRKEYLSHMVQYREELRRLFPDYEYLANHHVAFHIPEFMAFFGPVHGWWTYPYERMIGMLQRISTNHKPGEYEETIARSWYRSTYFRAMFTKANCPQAIRNCAEMFDTLVQPQSRNSLAIDVQLSAPGEDDDDDEGEPAEGELNFDGPTIRLDHELRQALAQKQPGKSVPTTAVRLTRYTRDGVNYSIKDVHEGNSGVLCKDSESPYCIEQILAFPEDVTNRSIQGMWLVVRRHKVPEIRIDPYGRYPLLRAKLWSTQLESTVDVLNPTEIDSHFAKCVIHWEGEEVAVVISLSRSMRIVTNASENNV